MAVATEHLFWRPQSLPFRDYFRAKKGGLWDLYLSMGASAATIAGNSGLARKSYYGLKAALTRTRRTRIKEALTTQFGIQAPFLSSITISVTPRRRISPAASRTRSSLRRTVRATANARGSMPSRAGNSSTFTALIVTTPLATTTHTSPISADFRLTSTKGRSPGLAAYGQPTYIDLLRRYVAQKDGQICNLGRCFDHSAIRKLKRELGEDFSHEDLSASVQLLLEDTVAHFTDYWVRQSGMKNVALAGGVFANVKLNQRIHELDSVERTFVHPGMGDEGLGVGAALYEANRQSGYRCRPVLKDVYFGADCLDTDCRRAIDDNALTIICKGEGIERTAAELIAAGKIVARCAGRMEYGPRALGNRSILYQATDRSVNKWLNERLKRTEFMPFAPLSSGRSATDVSRTWMAQPKQRGS